MKSKELLKQKNFFTGVNIQKDIVENLKNINGIVWEIQQYNYLYIIHKIINHNIMNYKETNGCLIHAGFLSKLFSKPNQQTAQIFKNLIKWKIIYISEEHDVENKRSTKYQLTNKYINDSFKLIQVQISQVSFIKKLLDIQLKEYDNDKFLFKTYKILKSSLKINDLGYEYFYNRYYNSNNGYSLNGYQDLKELFSQRKSNLLEIKGANKALGGCGIERRDIPLFLICMEEYYCTRPLDFNGNKSRLYNNLTNLPRDHRKYINFCDSPLLMTDIANSQILLSVPIIEKYYKVYSGKGIAGIPEDVKKFKQWAESGMFYEKFAKLLTPIPLTSAQRSEFKIYVFRTIWFGRNNKYFPKMKATFRKAFPNVFNAITQLKIVDHAQFSIELQRFEAEIMIDKVAKKMISKTPILTLHDAIICKDDIALQEAENIITTVFSKSNLVPKFKRETEASNTILDEPESSIKNSSQVSLTMDVTNFRNIKPIEKRTFNTIPINEVLTEFRGKRKQYYQINENKKRTKKNWKKNF